ncbi:MAG TPA: threonine synthase [Steroidobacteraceae bacterium]
MQMRFASTRAAGNAVGFGTALQQGLAPDGGLYVPTRWPALPAAVQSQDLDLATRGARLLLPFLAGDPLEEELPAITREAFNFEAPLVTLDAAARLSLLELFHGPTAAFKDFGARFLAASLARVPRRAGRSLNMLVATSGDTGGAVAAAFHERPGMQVTVLFPKGLVSPTQERQLTCWGGNVASFAVRGAFDDCQRLVKEALQAPDLRARFDLSSANSINLGRLLPQMVYYAAASVAIHRAYGQRAAFIIPSGNLGNAVACIWARKVGLPIGDIVLAHNANRTVPDYLESGQWQPRASIPTLASAMDVGNPSNMERMRSLFPSMPELVAAVSAESVDDAGIRRRIRAAFDTWGKSLCPHTAVAAEVYARLPEARRRAAPWVIVSTAHAAKFREIVEPITGEEVPVPESLMRLFARPTACSEIPANLEDLRAALTA